MTIKQLFNVLDAHPDVSQLNPMGSGHLSFWFTFENYNDSNGGELEIEIVVEQEGSDFIFVIQNGVCGAQPFCVLVGGNFSPETVCKALRCLAENCGYHRGDYIVGDGRMCRGGGTVRLYCSVKNAVATASA